MDHTPRQRRFSDIQKYKDYVREKHGMDAALCAEFLWGLQLSLGGAHEAAVVAAVTRHGATLSSHDDSTVGQVDTSHKYGIKLAEFPTTMAAADACHPHSIATITSAANVLRGGSHSGIDAALDLANSDRLDILSLDYILANLLTVAVQLGSAWNDLPGKS